VRRVDFDLRDFLKHSGRTGKKRAPKLKASKIAVAKKSAFLGKTKWNLGHGQQLRTHGGRQKLGGKAQPVK